MAFLTVFLSLPVLAQGGANPSAVEFITPGASQTVEITYRGSIPLTDDRQILRMKSAEFNHTILTELQERLSDGLAVEGTVLSAPDSHGEVQLQAGIMKFKANISQLRLLKDKQEKEKKPKTSVVAQTGAMDRTVKMECDVRGMTREEAILTVDQYLDAAVLAGMGEVSIIHGKGTGVLRAGIQQELRRHPHVKSMRLGVYGEGEDGVTIVKLK